MEQCDGTCSMGVNLISFLIKPVKGKDTTILNWEIKTTSGLEGISYKKIRKLLILYKIRLNS